MSCAAQRNHLIIIVTKKRIYSVLKCHTNEPMNIRIHTDIIYINIIELLSSSNNNSNSRVWHRQQTIVGNTVSNCQHFDKLNIRYQQCQLPHRMKKKAIPQHDFSLKLESNCRFAFDKDKKSLLSYCVLCV